MPYIHRIIDLVSETYCNENMRDGVINIQLTTIKLISCSNSVREREQSGYIKMFKLLISRLNCQRDFLDLQDSTYILTQYLKQ